MKTMTIDFTVQHWRYRRPYWLVLFFFVVLPLLGCGGQEEVDQPIQKFDFELEVDTTDLDGNPIPGIPVLLDDEVVGFTDADGKFRGTLHEEPSKSVRLGVDNIDGFRATVDELHTEQVLNVIEAFQGGYQGLPVTLHIEFQSLRSEYFSWIQATCGDGLDDNRCKYLPVHLGDEEVARTDAEGFAHFSFEGIPGQLREISIVTPRYDSDDDDSTKFEPQSPEYEIELTPNATIFHIKEEFSDPDYEPPRRRRPRRPTPPPTPQPQLPTDDDGVWDPFADN